MTQSDEVIEDLRAEIADLRQQVAEWEESSTNWQILYQQTKEQLAEAEAEVTSLHTRLVKVRSALNELGDVRRYGERNSTYYCGAQTMAKRVEAVLADPS